MYTNNVAKINSIDDFDKQYVALRKEGFIWAVHLLATMSDSNSIYEQIINDWSSLDTITGKDIAIVIGNSSSSLPLPFSFENNLHRVPYFNDLRESRNISNANTIMSEVAARYFNISIMQFPCLVFVNLQDRNAAPIVISLQNDTRLYHVMKYIVFRVKDLTQALKVHINQLSAFKNEHLYDDLTKKFKNAIINEALCEDDPSAETIDHLLHDLNNNYAVRTLERLLQQLRQRKVWLYGDSKRESILTKIQNCYNQYPDFEERFSNYNAILKQINDICNNIIDVIQNVDINNCERDAEAYALQLLNNMDTTDVSDAQLQASLTELIVEMRNSIHSRVIEETLLKKWSQRVESVMSKIEQNYAYRAFGIACSLQTITQLLMLVTKIPF